jgi:hypothetical protein
MPVLVNPVGFGSGTPAGFPYVGTNAVGGSLETMTRHRVYAKQVTLATDMLIVSISAYMQASATDTRSALSVGLFTDVTGTPDAIVAISGGISPALIGSAGSEVLLEAAVGVPTGRWLTRPLGYWATAGDYWLAVQDNSGGPGRIAYDATGSDRYYSATSIWFTDWGLTTPTTSANDYSIRAEAWS